MLPRLQQCAYFTDQARDVDLGVVRLAAAPLAGAVVRECTAWSSALMAAMRELDEARLGALRSQMSRYVANCGCM